MPGSTAAKWAFSLIKLSEGRADSDRKRKKYRDAGKTYRMKELPEPAKKRQRPADDCATRRVRETAAAVPPSSDRGRCRTPR